jgi:hypothetical protein
MEILNLVLNIVIIAFSVYLVFFKSYLSEKGKNAATKEDIGNITKEIETVKSEVKYLNQIKFEISLEKKEVALDFYNQASFFIDYTTKIIDVLMNNQNDLKLISKQIEDIRFQMSKLFGSFLKLIIYFDKNSSFIKNASNYYDSANKIQQMSNLYLIQLENNAQQYALILDSLREGDFSKKDELMRNVNRSKELTNDFVFGRKDLIENEVLPCRGAFIVELSELINNSIKSEITK